MATALQPATSHLRHLSLADNQVTGNLSAACGLSGLASLHLTDNKLTGRWAVSALSLQLTHSVPVSRRASWLPAQEVWECSVLGSCTSSSVLL